MWNNNAALTEDGEHLASPPLYLEAGGYDRTSKKVEGPGSGGETRRETLAKMFTTGPAGRLNNMIN